MHLTYSFMSYNPLAHNISLVKNCQELWRASCCSRPSACVLLIFDRYSTKLVSNAEALFPVPLWLQLIYSLDIMQAHGLDKWGKLVRSVANFSSLLEFQKQSDQYCQSPSTCRLARYYFLLPALLHADCSVQWNAVDTNCQFQNVQTQMPRRSPKKVAESSLFWIL